MSARALLVGVLLAGAVLALSHCGSHGSPATPATTSTPPSTPPPPTGTTPGMTPVPDAGVGRPVKVMVINMFFGEAQPFIDALGLKTDVPVPGLSTDYPNVHCNADDVCEITTGMGYANAASSMSALLYRGGFDLTHAYFIIAGIAGIDATQGTLGSAAWARYVVDGGVAAEIDAREMPAGWPYGYFGIGTKTPSDKPTPSRHTEVYQLDEVFLQKALALSKNATLDDSADAIKFRAKYGYAPANMPPQVIQCDSLSSNTWYAGAVLSARARDFVKLVTDGKGVFCTSQQEDNATLEVLRRGAAAGKLDFTRVAALRSGSDFSQPYAGQTDEDCLVNYLLEGGFTISTSNLAKTALPVIHAIVSDWSTWQTGVPMP